MVHAAASRCQSATHVRQLSVLVQSPFSGNSSHSRMLARAICGMPTRHQVRCIPASTSRRWTTSSCLRADVIFTRLRSISDSQMPVCHADAQVSVSIAQMLSWFRTWPCREHHTIRTVASTRTPSQLLWQRKCARHSTRSCSQWRPSSIFPLSQCKMSSKSCRWSLLQLHFARPARYSMHGRVAHGCRLHPADGL